MSSLDRHDDLPDAVRADLLSSKRRCRILHALAAAGGEVSVTDLAVETCALETGRSPERIEPEAIETIRYEIYERHLPKLTLTGVVEYDSALDKLRLTDSTVHREAKHALE